SRTETGSAAVLLAAAIAALVRANIRRGFVRARLADGLLIRIGHTGRPPADSSLPVRTPSFKTSTTRVYRKPYKVRVGAGAPIQLTNTYGARSHLRACSTLRDSAVRDWWRRVRDPTGAAASRLAPTDLLRDPEAVDATEASVRPERERGSVGAGRLHPVGK